MVTTLYVKKIINNFTNNNTSGQILFDVIKTYLDRQETVIVSFEGVSEISSSFVNSAFIELLSFFDFEYIKLHLSFIDSTKQMNALIRDRFLFEVANKKVVVV